MTHETLYLPWTKSSSLSSTYQAITWFILWSPFLFALAYYGDQHHLELQAQPFPKTYYLVAFALLSALISQILNWICYEKLLGFQKLNNLRILSRFLLETIST